MATKLKLVPGLTDLFDDFHEKYNASADEFIAAGVKQKERVEEIRAFDYELRNLQRTAASSTDLLRKYTKQEEGHERSRPIPRHCPLG